jgi:hypothetical protein
MGERSTGRSKGSDENSAEHPLDLRQGIYLKWTAEKSPTIASTQKSHSIWSANQSDTGN